MRKSLGAGFLFVSLTVASTTVGCSCDEKLVALPEEPTLAASPTSGAVPETTPPLLPSPADCTDLDGDGYGVGPGCLGPDCDDADGVLGGNGHRPCYTGPAATLGVGTCAEGVQTCVDGVLSGCVGETVPTDESCDGKDNDCDGTVDEEVSRSCYDGPPGTGGVGQCAAGTQSCANGVFGPCENAVLPAPEVCDDVDNDCDGAIDDGVSQGCYTGPAGTENVGLCKGGYQGCSTGSFGKCMAEVVPAPEVCDNQDNDCDGQTDDGVVQACYTGPAGTLGVGQCKGGVQSCASGAWLACLGEVLPSVEVCDGIDNDCDGQVDEGVSQLCYTGPSGTLGVGTCQAGTQVCTNGAWSACVGDVVPRAETCDGVDTNCDGQIDENVIRSCYTGPAGTEGVGLCAAGTQVCTAGSWGACAGDVLPALEVCDGGDNDCDGQTDEQLTRTCYSGPANTQGVGACRAGTETCNAGSWGSCAGEVLPGAETCDAVDNNCDGTVDEGLTRTCYDGPATTKGVGVCKTGVSTCSMGSYGACAGEVVPSAEQCDSLDNDCDGAVDENVTRSCYSGPAGTSGVGLCTSGVQTCFNGAFGGCAGEVVPAAETCDGRDNDCDGQTDEALVRSCYTGPAGTQGVGACGAGTQACSNAAWGTCTGQTQPKVETCNNVDDDCDGSVDEGVTQVCYDGPSGTSGVGACRSGTQTCSAGTFGACNGEVLPTAEGCDGVDNDCDGQTDEALVRACYDGPSGTEGVGTCVRGSQSCSAGSWGSCAGEVLPRVETCNNADDDCDGAVDDNVTRACYGGPAGTAGVGVCQGGTQTCVAGVFGGCVGEVRPSAELCDSKDNDCNGQVDENLSRVCYGGPAGTAGVGLCKTGVQSCTGGSYGLCQGEVTPKVETCDNADNDCDGQVDESLTRSCYDGPAGTAGVGVCRSGTQTCVAGQYGGCVGEALPSAELCDNADNDCNGAVDENLARTCYDGPAGTAGVGMCQSGTQSCAAGSWGACAGEVTPGWGELCESGVDENCNGQVDEAGCIGVGTWVCTSCANALDTNPGTQAEPLKTIAKGLAQAAVYGFNRVYVANVNGSTAAVYAEDVTMVEGISIQGRWDPTVRPWVRTAQQRTIIRPTRAAGLVFPSGITRATSLDGIEVQSAGGNNSTTAVAVDVQSSSPTLRDVTLGGLAPGASTPGTSVGLRVTGAGAYPRVEGVSDSSRSVARGGAASSLAIAIAVSGGAKVDVQWTNPTGGTAGANGEVRGISLTDAAGSTIRNSDVLGGNAGTNVGLYATGAVGGLVVEGAAITGAQTGPVTPARAAGVLLTTCTTATPSAPTFRANSLITGGQGTDSAIGLAAIDNCAPVVTDNTTVSGGGVAAQATGILCANQIWGRTAGADSACVVERNVVYGGLSTSVSDAVGIACLSGCATKTLACAGSCARLVENSVSATAGLTLTHVRLLHSSPLVARNKIGIAGAGVACTLQTGVTGLKAQGSASRVESNFILAGPCESAYGLVQVNEKRTGDSSWPAPDVHSNTILGGGSSANTTGSQSFGVVLQTVGNATPPRLGKYRNNILVGGQNNHRTTFDETAANADPELLVNNDFLNFDRSNGPNPILYMDENSKTLMTVAEIQALTDTTVSGTLSVDPLFVNTFFDFHLQAVSPLRDLGLADQGPTRDIDGDSRPIGDKPDIGADEIR